MQHFDMYMEKFYEAYKYNAILPKGEFFGTLVEPMVCSSSEELCQELGTKGSYAHCTTFSTRTKQPHHLAGNIAKWKFKNSTGITNIVSRIQTKSVDSKF